MNENVNYPLSFIVAYTTIVIFVTLYWAVLIIDISDYSVMLDTIISTSCGMMMLLLYSVYSSMIPKNLHKIRVTAREKINDFVFDSDHSIPQNVMLCLRRIETENVIHITVCDMFSLTKSFILSAIGVIFTYDLLIISAFTSYEK